MKILSYSPKVEAYVSTESGIYDISEDIVGGTVNRRVDAPSDFKLNIVNRGDKYINVFSPMDRITIYLTKTERRQVLTGYITEVPKFGLYQTNMSISGSCSLYRLQCLYWDPGLYSSKKAALSGVGTTMSSDQFILGVLNNLLCLVAGYDPNKVLVGDMPEDVINLAMELFEAKKTDYAQSLNLADEFYEMLKKTNLSVEGMEAGASSGASGGPADFSGSDTAEIIWNFLRSQGFTKEAAAAVMGNMQQESGLNPASNQGGGGPGRGLLQWEAGGSRFEALCSFASGMGSDWSDLQAQLLFFVQEAPSQFDTYSTMYYVYSTGAVAGLGRYMSFDEYRGLTDIAWATEAFERVYTRASMPMTETRVSYAKGFYELYAGK